MRRLPLRAHAPRTSALRLAALSAAALPLLFAPPAFAGDTTAKPAKRACPPPEIDHSYSVDTPLRVDVHLLATGCPSRENSMFTVSALLTRVDELGPQESVWHSVRCGPFETAEDRERIGMAPGEYFCNLDLALGHPPIDDSRYEVEVTYPGRDDAEETTRLALVCTSDGNSAVCDHENF